jgi:hypothetical protein
LIAGSISNVPCSGNGPLRAATSLPVSCRNGRLRVRRAKCVRMKEFPPGSKRDPCCVRPMCTGSNKNRPGFQISDQATLNADPICLRRYAMKPSAQKAKDHWIANFFRATKPKSLKARRPDTNIGSAGGRGTTDTDVTSSVRVRPDPSLPADPNSRLPWNCDPVCERNSASFEVRSASLKNA